MVDAALRHGVPRFIYISSLSVLHATAPRNGKLITEDFPLEPHADRRGHYSKAKRDAEVVVTEAVKSRRLPAVILRPGRVFGPGAPLMTPDVGHVVGSKIIVLGDGKLVPPLVYVEDVIDAILLAANANVFDGSIFNLVDEEQISQEQIIHEYLRASGQTKRIVHVPRWFLHTAALGLEMLGKAIKRPVPLTRYRLNSSFAPLACDCTAARQKLGWQPRVGVRAGIAETLRTM
jgi:nucleoside-diphosphate-sugar epimerase